jgi:flagella basal body P-ring formation protein FlgA
LKYLFPLSLVVSLLVFPLAAAAQISVNFQAKASITAAKIVLADIAVIQPAGDEADKIGQLPVTAAPAPGTAKELTTVTVITSLRNRPEVADVDWQGSETIVVQRKGNRVTQEQLQKIIADYLQENVAKLPKADIRFSAVKVPEALILPMGELKWRVTPSNPDIMGSSSFSIFFTVDGKPAGNCLVRGKLEAMADVATAIVTLHKGDLITADKISMERRSLDRLDNPILNKEQLIGKQMERTLTVGKPIEQKDIAAPAVIKDGEMVKMIARKGSLQISTSGIAKTDGRLGETIQVKNIGSSKLVHCRVDGPGIVSVEF